MPSLVISVLLATFVVFIIISISITSAIWLGRIDDSLAMLEDGRYTRRAIVGHMIWNGYRVSVMDHGRTLQIADQKHTTFHYTKRALYRRLSDGNLQPLSGSRIVGAVDKRKVDTTQAFSLSKEGAIHMHWTVNNRFLPNHTFSQGYGGIASYEVCTSISSHYDWYK